MRSRSLSRFLLPLLALAAPAAGSELARGLADYELGRYADARRRLAPAAEAGDAEARYRLAILLRQGWGGPPDAAEGERWVRAAAESGHAGAQSMLASIAYTRGGIIRTDDSEADRWWRASARQGRPVEMNILGSALRRRPSPSDAQRVEAYQWLALAGERGLQDAHESLRALANAMPPELVREAEAGLPAFRESALGLPPADPAPGAELCAGLAAARAKRWDEARRLLAGPAREGHAEAQVYLGVMLFAGNGGPRDKPEGMRLLRAAAEAGEARAQALLGTAHYHGDGVPKDTAEAERWWRLAAARRLPAAMHALGQYARQTPAADLRAAYHWRRLAEEFSRYSAASLYGDAKSSTTLREFQARMPESELVRALEDYPAFRARALAAGPDGASGRGFGSSGSPPLAAPVPDRWNWAAGGLGAALAAWLLYRARRRRAGLACRTFSIANPADGAAFVAAVADVPWLSVEPVSATLRPGESREFRVLLDARARPPGAAGSITVRIPAAGVERVIAVPWTGGGA